MATPEPFAIARQMGLTHREFFRSLPAAVAGIGYRIDGTQVLIEESTRRIEIRLGPERKSRLGSLTLPRTQVRLIFGGFSDEERVAFLERFDRAFQRGGG